MIKEKKKFGELELSEELMQAILDMGFEEPSPIQAQAIPYVLEGKDIIGQAQTGTGKTAAFGIPIIESTIRPKYRVQALVLTPTRELAVQVSEEMSKIGKYKKIKTLPIYGGQSIDMQIKALQRGVHIVVGTPGRIMDHIKRKTLILNQVKTVVLDEADEMLDMGFVEDIEFILKEIPTPRQTVLFSATMPAPIKKLASSYMIEPQNIAVSRDVLTVPKIDQVYYAVKKENKLNVLCRILDMENIGLSILFCRTKKGVDELAESLQARGYLAEGLHGDLSQAQRNRVMKKFRDANIELLVATDVAARGLDIENVSHVINYDIPQDPESYVHRIGRTGRAGKSGAAITLVTPWEFKQMKLIEKVIKKKVRQKEIPTMAEVEEKQRSSIKEQLAKIIERGQLGSYKEVLGDLMEDYDVMDLAAAALKLAFQDNGEAPKKKTK